MPTPKATPINWRSMRAVEAAITSLNSALKQLGRDELPETVEFHSTVKDPKQAFGEVWVMTSKFTAVMKMDNYREGWFVTDGKVWFEKNLLFTFRWYQGEIVAKAK